MRTCWSLLVLASLASTAAAQVPTLSHTAPKLGSALTLELEGAQAAAQVRLYVSPAEASTTTPYGTLELKRDGIVLLASGQTDPQGSFAFTQLVPLDPAKAETWGHYQALVQSATAPGGWVLSQAAHLRYLGTRLYETCLGGQVDTTVYPAELRVVSLVQNATLGSVPLDAGALPYVFARQGQGEPLFSADLSLGAVVPAADRLVIFDNFDLTPLAVLPLQGASRELIAGLDGESVVVLEAGAGRIVWVDLTAGTVSDSLTLPWPLSAHWTSPDGGHRAWVGESPAGAARPGLRHVDLEARVVLEGVLVGSPDGCWLTDVRSSPGVVFASAHYLGIPPFDNIASVSAVDLSASPPAVQTKELGGVSVQALQPLEELGMLALPTASSFGPSSQVLHLAPLNGSLTFRTAPPPPSYWLGNDIEYRAFEVDGSQLWALHPCCDWDGGAGSLMRLSFDPQQWEELGGYGWGGPLTMELASDGLVHLVAAALDGVPCAGCPTPRIDLLDVPTLTFGQLPGGWGPIALRALTVP